MSTLANLIVRIGADATQLEKHLGKVESRFKKLGSQLQDIGSRLTVGLTLPIVGAGVAAAKMAMDAIESENLFEVAMGGMADAARKWSEELRQQLGLNAYEVRKNVGTFDVMLKSMGMAEDAAFDMSKSLTLLAYDMASFYNLRPEEAFEKLQAGITGEIEPLKRLGIVVNESTVQTYAYTHGIAAQGAQLTEQQKILARYGVIMEQTKAAQGDLARTIDSPVNQFRILSETLKQTAIDLGMALMPAVQAIIPHLQNMVERISGLVAWFTSLSPTTQNWIIMLLGVLAALGPVLSIVGVAIKTISGLVGVVKTLATVFSFLATNPIGLVIAAVGALIAIGIVLWKNWDKIKDWFGELWGKIVGIFNWAKEQIAKIIDKILAPIQWVIDKVQSALDWLRKFSVAGSTGGLAGEPVAPPHATPVAMQTGGIVRRPTVALIGESGPEAVIPLPLDRLGFIGAGPVTIIVELDGRQVARTTAPYLTELIRVKTGVTY